MRSTKRWPLYLLGGVASIIAIFVAVLIIGSREAAGGGEVREMVSAEGRIRVALVQSYADSHESLGQFPDVEPGNLSAVYVPSYLPEGLSHSHTRLLTESSAGQLFEGGDTTLMIVGASHASPTAKAGFVEATSVNGRSAFLVHGGWISSDRSATWDPGKSITLLLEMDDGIVNLHSEGSGLTEQEMVRIAGSLEPSQDALASLAVTETNPYERVINEMGKEFGTLYAPTYLPEGYSAQGNQAWPKWGYTELRFRNLCELIVRQRSQDSRVGPEIIRRATFGPHDTVVKRGNEIYTGYKTVPELIRGVQFYVSDPHPITYTEHWFEHKGIWFNISTGAHSVCVTLSLEEIARIAKSLRPVG